MTAIFSGSILMLDPAPAALETIKSSVSGRGYDVIACRTAKDAVTTLRKSGVATVVVELSGENNALELLESVRKVTPNIPAIFMTAKRDYNLALKAVKNGAFDLITTPCPGQAVLECVEKALDSYYSLKLDSEHRERLEDSIRKKAEELADALNMNRHLSIELIQRLIAIAEWRDPETGTHISRTALYTREISNALGMPETFIEKIAFASPMHDIGKVGISDSVLLKPGKLTFEEYEIMKTHTSIGSNLLSGSTHPSIQMAASIAISHHERWDGSGYPRGLKGEDIPMEGRIVMVCDCYDALRSKRPYKDSISHEDSVKMLVDGDGTTAPRFFDPYVLDAFKKVAPAFDEIYNTNQD